VVPPPVEIVTATPRGRTPVPSVSIHEDSM
jgi:hypothetical protein